MKELTGHLFTLLHITSNKCLKKIKKSHGFISSIHNVEKNKIEWLGDGIYFWDSNDPYAIKLGKKLVKGRAPYCKMVGIIVSLEIDKERFLDLDNQNWNSQYVSFLKSAYPDYYQKILEYKKIIQEHVKASTNELNELGKVTGKTINDFLLYLKEQKEKEFDIVLGYFHHENIKENILILGRDRKDIAQYCIKNEKLVNNNMEEWIVDTKI